MDRPPAPLDSHPDAAILHCIPLHPMAHSGWGAEAGVGVAGRSQQAYEELLRLIRSGELAPGATVTEQDLVARIGVSRTPIREALVQAAQHGLVRRLPGSSVVVESIDLSRYLQLAEVRGVLESYAARLFAQHATATDRAVLARLAETVDAVTAAGDDEQVLVADLQFHEFVVKRSGNTELAALVARTHLLTTFFGVPTPAAASNGAADTPDHRALARVLSQGDPDAAEDTMRRHTGIDPTSE